MKPKGLKISGGIPRMTAWVATGIKTGVSVRPWAVSKEPARAAYSLSVLSTVNLKLAGT